MLAFRKLTLRQYIVMNLLMGALVVNVALFGPALDMGDAFTAGLAVGLGIAWLVYAVAGWIELRKPGRSFDERAQAAFAKACALAFWVLIVGLNVGVALLRSRTLSLGIGAGDLAAYASELGIAVFAVAFFIFERRD
jgi:predicted RND superfamily exporter protein